MKVGVLAVEEVGVWAPDLGEELPVHGQLLHVRSVVLQPAVNPVLPAYRGRSFKEIEPSRLSQAKSAKV